MEHEMKIIINPEKSDGNNVHTEFDKNIPVGMALSVLENLSKAIKKSMNDKVQNSGVMTKKERVDFLQNLTIGDLDETNDNVGV